MSHPLQRAEWKPLSDRMRRCHLALVHGVHKSASRLAVCAALTTGLLIPAFFAKDAVALCVQTDSGGFRCSVDGGATGQLFSPASKIVRQGLVLRVVEERRRARDSSGDLSKALPADQSAAALAEDVGFAQLGTSYRQRTLFEGGGTGARARSPAGSQKDGESAQPALVDTGPLGIFLLGSVGFEDQEETNRENGFDTDRVGVAGGVDLQVEHLLVGIAIDYVGEDTDFDHDAGDAHNDEVGLQVFGVYSFTPQAYAMAGARIAANDYDITRNILITPTDPIDGPPSVEEANDKTDGYKYSFFAGGGYQFDLGSGFATALSGSIEYERTKVDAYSDDPDVIQPGAALRFEDDEITTLTSTIEARLQKAFELNRGFVIPWMYFRYFHEFEDDSRTVTAEQINDIGLEGPTSVNFRTNDPDRNYFSVGGGVLGTLDDRWSAFASYDVLLGHSVRDEQTISFGLRLGF